MASFPREPTSVTTNSCRVGPGGWLPTTGTHDGSQGRFLRCKEIGRIGPLPRTSPCRVCTLRRTVPCTALTGRSRHRTVDSLDKKRKDRAFLLTWKVNDTGGINIRAATVLRKSHERPVNTVGDKDMHQISFAFFCCVPSVRNCETKNHNNNPRVHRDHP